MDASKFPGLSVKALAIVSEHNAAISALYAAGRETSAAGAAFKRCRMIDMRFRAQVKADGYSSRAAQEMSDEVSDYAIPY